MHIVRTSCTGTPAKLLYGRRPQNSVRTLAWFMFLLYIILCIITIIMIILFTAADVGDTGAEFDRVFLQELRDLKVFVNDKDIVEEHKR